MSFNETIRSIAIEIHNKVVNFIESNNNNDDLLYENIFFKTKNNNQIEYNFEKDEIRVYKDSSYINVFWILDNETTYVNRKIQYDTSLEKKALEDPDCFDLDLEEQNKYSKEVKDNILKFYKEIYDLLDELEIDQTKTYDVNNFNEEFFDFYNEYMYGKEFNKLKESGKKILPAVEIAAEWWKNKIIKENAYLIPGKRKSLGYFELIEAPTTITDEQYNKFKDILATKLMNEIYELKDDVVQIRCDYGPSHILNSAGLEAGLKGAKTPTKTDMYIRAYYVAIKDGYGAPCVTIYDSTKKEDIETIKKLYIDNSKVLKK